MTTRVIHLGETVSGASGALMVVEVDPVKHPDGNGGVVRSFLPGEDVYLLIHHDPEIAVVRVMDTAGGDLLRVGSVFRNNTERLSWAHADDVKDLLHNPATQPAPSWFGRIGLISRDGRSLRITGAPAMADVSYSYQAIQYRYRLPAEVELGADETFPVELIIETEE